MADLHHTRTPGPDAGIDTVGWLFLVACAIVAIAAVITYEASDTKAANSSVPPIASR